MDASNTQACARVRGAGEGGLHLEGGGGNWTLKTRIGERRGGVGPGRPPKKHRETMLRNLRTLQTSSVSCNGRGRNEFPLVALWLEVLLHVSCLTRCCTSHVSLACRLSLSRPLARGLPWRMARLDVG